MLQGAGLESQQELAMEKEKKEDALKLQGEANKNTCAWIAQCNKVENEAQVAADAQWEAVEQAEEATAALRQENEAMNESVKIVLRDAQSELRRETMNEEAVGEMAKYWQDKAHRARGEYTEAMSHREDEAAEMQMLRGNLDRSRAIKNQYRDSNGSMERLHYAERAEWESKENRLQASLAEYKKDLAECKAILPGNEKESSRVQDRLIRSRRCYLDQPLSDRAIHLHEVNALRVELAKEKEEAITAHRDLVNFNVQEHMTCVHLRLTLKEERAVTEEMEESQSEAKSFEARLIADLLDAQARHKMEIA